MTAAETAAGITPRVRDDSFVRSAAPQRRRLNGDPIASAVFDGLPATLSHGERFFMDAPPPYLNAAPGVLSAQIAAFIAQEALHTRERVSYNRHAAHGRRASSRSWACA